MVKCCSRSAACLLWRTADHSPQRSAENAEVQSLQEEEIPSSPVMITADNRPALQFSEHSASSAVIKRACLLIVALSACMASASTRKIGPDLYAYVSENDASANSTFLVSEQGILVVDTGLSAGEGRKLLDEIRKVSPARVRWIVNTHYHPDHRGGNAVVGPDAVVISTAFKRAQAGAAAPGYGVNETLGANGLMLFVGGHEVRIYHPGPAHTMGDVVVYFPSQHAIATGDLFLTNSCPAMDKGDMENWIHALD